MERWHVLYTKPHKEYLVSTFLESRGYQTYLPTVQVGEGGKGRRAPFFSCYLFIRMDAAFDIPQVSWVPGLRRIVSFGGRPAAVNDEVLLMLKGRLAKLEGLGYEGCRLEAGDRVVMTSGPLKGFEGVFERGLSSGERARILVDFLGCTARCEVGVDRLRKAG